MDKAEQHAEALATVLAPFVDLANQRPDNVKLISKSLGDLTPIRVTVTKAQMLAAHGALAAFRRTA